MQTKLIFSPEDSRANHTAAQEKDWEKKMNATCGPKCLEQYERLAQSTSWGKTFLASLVGMGGVVFDEVHSDLEAEGYEVQAVVIPAAAVNAPHGRDRVWFVAKNTMRSGRTHGKSEQERARLGKQRNASSGSNDGICLQTRYDSNTYRDGFNRRDKQNEVEPSQRRVDAFADVESLDRDVTNAPSERHRGRNDESRTNKPKGRWEMGSYSEEHRHGVWCEIAGCCWFASNSTSERGKWVIARKQRKISDTKQIKFRGGYSQSVIANTERVGGGKVFKNIQPEEPNGQRTFCDGGFGTTSDANSIGQEPRLSNTEREFSEAYGFKSFNRPNDWSQFPTQSPVCGGDDGISDKLDNLAVFDGIGKPRKPITFSKWRQEAVKAYGNAVVPQIPYQIFKAIIDTEK